MSNNPHLDYKLAFNNVEKLLLSYRNESEFIKQILSLCGLTELILKDDLNPFQLLIDKERELTYLTRDTFDLAKELENNIDKLYYGPEWLLNVFQYVNKHKADYENTEYAISPKDILIIYWSLLIILLSNNNFKNTQLFSFDFDNAINIFEKIFKSERLYKPKNAIKDNTSERFYTKLNFFEKIYNILNIVKTEKQPWINPFEDYRKLILDSVWCEAEDYRRLVRAYELLKLENKKANNIQFSQTKRNVKSFITKLNIKNHFDNRVINLNKFIEKYI